MAKTIKQPAYINADNYLMVEIKENVVTDIGWKLETIKDDTRNLFAPLGDGLIYSMTVGNNSQQSQRQSKLSTQIIHGRSVMLTLAATYVGKNGKTLNKKRSLKFPAKCPVIWVTQALYEYITSLNVLHPIRGLATYKLVNGSRYGIGAIPDSALTTSINEWNAAKAAQALASRESTTTTEPLEPESIP